MYAEDAILIFKHLIFLARFFTSSSSPQQCTQELSLYHASFFTCIALMSPQPCLNICTALKELPETLAFQVTSQNMLNLYIHIVTVKMEISQFPPSFSGLSFTVCRRKTSKMLLLLMGFSLLSTYQRTQIRLALHFMLFFILLSCVQIKAHINWKQNLDRKVLFLGLI